MFNRHTLYYLRLLLPYSIGVFASLYLISDRNLIFALFLPGLLIALLYYLLPERLKIVYDFGYGLSLVLLMMAVGALRHYSYNELNQKSHFSYLETKPEFYFAKIEEEPLEKEGFFRCKISVTKAYFNLDSSISVSGSILAYFKKPVTQPLQIGDFLTVSAKQILPVPTARNPGEFDYKRFLSYKNIYYQSYFNPEEWQHSNQSEQSLKRWAAQSRNIVLARLGSIFEDPETRSFAEALLVGYKNNLSVEVVDAFSKTGTLHVLAVSGLHAGIIYLILNFLMRPFASRGRFGQVFRVMVVVIGMWAYAFITGLSPSVQRAALMLSLVQVAPLFNRKAKIYNSIFASAFFILLINPLLMVSVGFQLSYAAVLGIVYFQPKIKYWYVPSNKFVAFFWNLTAVSLAAQLATFPIGVFYFYQFPSYFLLSNLIIIPAILVTMGTLIAVAVFWSIPLIGAGLKLGASFLIGGVLWCVKIIESFPYASIDKLFLNPLDLILMYGLILTLSWWFIHLRKPFFHLACICLILLISSLGIRTYFQNKQHFTVVHHINKHQVISIVMGKQLFVIANSEFLNNESAKRFYLRPFISQNGLRDIAYFDWEDTVNNRAFKLKDNTLIFSNGVIQKHSFGYKIFEQKRHETYTLISAKRIPRHLQNESKLILQNGWMKL